MADDIVDTGETLESWRADKFNEGVGVYSLPRKLVFEVFSDADVAPVECCASLDEHEARVKPPPHVLSLVPSRVLNQAAETARVVAVS